MRVVCIDDDLGRNDDLFPPLQKRKIYHPINEREVDGLNYYALAECGERFGYWTGMFIEIEEDQPDETDFPPYQRALVPRIS